jgi:hypothetical protein
MYGGASNLPWAQAEGEDVALANGSRIISEPRKTGYMNEQTVSLLASTSG